MVEGPSHTLEWMRRLDRRFTTLSDRFDDLEARLAGLENRMGETRNGIDHFHQQAFRLDKRLERPEAIFETVQVGSGND